MKNYPVLFLLVFLIHPAYSVPDTWVQKTSLPAQPRAGAVAFSLHGYGFAGTGLDSSGNLLNDFWKYDPVLDSWSQSASFPGTPRKNAVAFVTDSFAYVGTGFDSTGLKKDFYKYDALLNSWQQVDDLDSAGTSYPRRDAAAFAIGNTGYVVGGYDGTTKYSKENWEYNEARDTAWIEKAVFPLDGRRWATSFAIDGHGFVGLGYNYSQEYFHDLWKYDSASNAWTQMADFTGNKRGYAPAFVINGYAFAGTGFDGALKNDFYRYNYALNTWSPVASYGGLPTSAAAAFTLNGKGYVVSGVDTFGYKNELWEYTPDDIVAIEKPSVAIKDIGVYPNPATTQIELLNLPFDGEKEFVLKLYDSFGKVIMVRTLTPAQKTADVKNLARGVIYFSLNRVYPGKPLVTGKVVLQ